MVCGAGSCHLPPPALSGPVLDDHGWKSPPMEEAGRWKSSPGRG